VKVTGDAGAAVEVKVGVQPSTRRHFLLTEDGRRIVPLPDAMAAALGASAAARTFRSRPSIRASATSARRSAVSDRRAFASAAASRRAPSARSRASRCDRRSTPQYHSPSYQNLAPL
jgi:hypothetical protein